MPTRTVTNKGRVITFDTHPALRDDTIKLLPGPGSIKQNKKKRISAWRADQKKQFRELFPGKRGKRNRGI